MADLFRRPLFWGVLGALALTGSYVFYTYYTTAFPVANITLTMNREQALEKAQELAQKFNNGPAHAWQTASFSTDADAKTYIELEAGGTPAFNTVIESGQYAPYTWQVRRFKEGDIHEVSFGFKPDGTPYEFAEQLSENDPGAKLDTERARAIAEEHAVRDWNINLNEYVLIETSQKEQPSGRIDHYLVYERPDLTIGQATYRLQLNVSGDRFTGLNHFLKIPEGFYLRYKKMRSANADFSKFAQFFIYIFYVFLGCGISLFLFSRQGRVLWRQPLLWAGLLALLTVAETINSFPLYWMQYNTALSITNFLINNIIATFNVALMSFMKNAIIFAAAETLSRTAFGHHVQTWRLWSAGAASSTTVIGTTLTSYLLVGLKLGFMVAFYFITRTFFGWWVPSDTLVDPNILAHHAPWFSAASWSLQAGFVEECLYRAVPLSCAALLGSYCGKRKQVLGIALILQAVIFGAAHASYPTQPAYGRIIEIFMPALIYGLIYIRWGLLSSMVAHTLYDLILMAMPLFISQAPGSRLSQGTVILWGFLPLFIILYHIYRRGIISQISQQILNSSWQPAPSVTTAVKTLLPITFDAERTRKIAYGALGIGTLGIALLLRPTNDAPPLALTRAQAITEAQNALKKEGFVLDPSWQVMAVVSAVRDMDDKFIWQQAGRGLYHKLIHDDYLTPPHWNIRYARFTGDLEERAEEFRVLITGTDNVVRITHSIPEKRPGSSLTEQQARVIAHQALQEKFSLDPTALQEVSALASKKPNRMDWEFVFAHPPAFTLNHGQARISIAISGDLVTDAHRYIHVPEVWLRQQHNEQTMHSAVQGLSGSLLFIFLALTMFYALCTFNFTVASLLKFGLLLFGLSVVNAFNRWPVVLAAFSTSEPFGSQVTRAIIDHFISGLMYAGIYGLLVSFFIFYKKKHHAVAIATRDRLVCGLGIGLLVFARMELQQTMTSALLPSWAVYGYLDHTFPLLSAVAENLFSLIGQTVLFIMPSALLLVIRQYRGFSFGTAMVVLTFFSFLIHSGSGIEAWGIMLINSLILGLILIGSYRLIVVFDYSVVLITILVAHVMVLFREALLNAYPGAALINGVTALALVGSAMYLFSLFNGTKTSQESTPLVQ